MSGRLPCEGVQTIRPMTQTARTIRTAGTDQFDIYTPRYDNSYQYGIPLCGRRGSTIQKGGFVQEFRLENRSYPDSGCS